MTYSADVKGCICATGYVTDAKKKENCDLSLSGTCDSATQKYDAMSNSCICNMCFIKNTTIGATNCVENTTCTNLTKTTCPDGQHAATDGSCVKNCDQNDRKFTNV